jgi:hypothetical protein
VQGERGHLQLDASARRGETRGPASRAARGRYEQ